MIKKSVCLNNNKWKMKNHFLAKYPFSAITKDFVTIFKDLRPFIELLVNTNSNGASNELSKTILNIIESVLDIYNFFVLEQFGIEMVKALQNIQKELQDSSPGNGFVRSLLEGIMDNTDIEYGQISDEAVLVRSLLECMGKNTFIVNEGEKEGPSIEDYFREFQVKKLIESIEKTSLGELRTKMERARTNCKSIYYFEKCEMEKILIYANFAKFAYEKQGVSDEGIFKSFEFNLDGYFARYYFMKKNGIVIVTHRGTILEKENILNDIQLVCGEPLSYFNLLEVLLGEIKKKANEIGFEIKCIKTTGHSLGGVLSDQFCHYCLEKKFECFSITFENPGVEINNVVDTKKFIVFNNEPNIINTLNAKVGVVHIFCHVNTHSIEKTLEKITRKLKECWIVDIFQNKNEWNQFFNDFP